MPDIIDGAQSFNQREFSRNRIYSTVRGNGRINTLRSKVCTSPCLWEARLMYTMPSKTLGCQPYINHINIHLFYANQTIYPPSYVPELWSSVNPCIVGKSVDNIVDDVQLLVSRPGIIFKPQSETRLLTIEPVNLCQEPASLQIFFLVAICANTIVTLRQTTVIACIVLFSSIQSLRWTGCVLLIARISS